VKRLPLVEPVLHHWPIPGAIGLELYGPAQFAQSLVETLKPHKREAKRMPQVAIRAYTRC
jgi:hypothetical protein